MKIALGTLEIDEDTRKKLGKHVHGSSYLKRDEGRDWALGLINDALDKVRSGELGKAEKSKDSDDDSVDDGDDDDDSENAPAGAVDVVPVDEQEQPNPGPSALEESGGLPEPAPATAPTVSGPTTAGTTPTATGTTPGTV